MCSQQQDGPPDALTTIARAFTAFILPVLHASSGTVHPQRSSPLRDGAASAKDDYIMELLNKLKLRQDGEKGPPTGLLRIERGGKREGGQREGGKERGGREKPRGGAGEKPASTMQVWKCRGLLHSSVAKVSRG